MHADRKPISVLKSHANRDRLLTDIENQHAIRWLHAAYLTRAMSRLFSRIESMSSNERLMSYRLRSSKIESSIAVRMRFCTSELFVQLTIFNERMMSSILMAASVAICSPSLDCDATTPRMTP